MWVEGEDQNCRQGEVRYHESQTSRGYRKVYVWRLQRVNGKSNNSSEMKAGNLGTTLNCHHIMILDLGGIKYSEFIFFFN